MEGIDFALLISKEMAQIGDAIRSEGMEKYMRNKFPFWGIDAATRRKKLSELLKEYGKPSAHQVEDVILELWQLEEREAQYIALDILEKTRFWQEEQSIDLFEQLILSKSWWDTVDSLASRMVGNYFRFYPENKLKQAKIWNESPNFWLVRTSIIFQLKYKSTTNLKLLTNCIVPHLSDSEFFIQKAIGWSLREVAKTYPSFTKSFAEQYPLSNLAKREALKHL